MINRTIKYWIIICLALAFANSGFAQLQIIVGTQGESSGTGAAPYNNNSKSYRIMMIYTAAEINAALTSAGISTGSPRDIVGLSWDVVSNHALNDLTNYEVHMGNTSEINLNYHLEDAVDNVKSAFTYSPSGTGWQYIGFDSNFAWDGTSNIIVEVCWQTSYSSNGASCWMFDDGSTEYRMRWEYSGFSSMCGGYTWGTSLSNPDLKPRIRFAFECDPITVSVTPVADICNSTTVANLTGNVPAALHTGKWTVVSGTGTFTNDSDNDTEVTNVGQGSNVYRWTITKTADGCAEYADLTVLNNTPSTPDAGANAGSCTASYPLNGNVPVYGTGQWSVTAGTGVFDDNTIYNTNVSNMTGSDAGTANTFTWTITNNGCSLSDAVTITYYLPPEASVVTSPLTGCYATDILTLNGNDPSALSPAATGEWSVVSGSGTFANSTLYNTTVTNVGTPTNTYRWTLTRNGCISSANLVVNNSSPSLATAGTNQTISNSSTTLQGNSPEQGTGTWTVLPSGPTIVSINDPNTVVNNITENIMYTFTWTIANSTCASASDNVTVTRMPGILGLVIQDDLTNNGSMIQTEDNNFFVMTGSANHIYGGLSTNNTYTDTKLRVTGNITYDGAIDNGKFAKTQVTATGVFTVNHGLTYKNHELTNYGDLNLNASSIFENSGNWTNSSDFVANSTSTVIFNGDALQTVTTDWDGSNNEFGNVEIAQTVVTPTSANGIDLQDDFVVQENSVIEFNKGVVVIEDADAFLIVENDASNAVTGDFTQSWVYGTSNSRAFRRYLDEVNAQDYVFPVGQSSNPNIAILTNNNLPDGSLYIDSWFKPSPTSINTNFPTALDEGDFRYNEVLEEGIWILKPTGSINGTYDLKLYHNEFGLTAADDNEFCILKRPLGSGDGSSWIIPPTTSVFVQLPAATGYAQRTGINAFSEFAIGKNFNTLPVTLNYFKANCEGQNIKLSWSTLAEINNDYFTIERSYDAVNFHPITTIEGAGNSNVQIDYSWFDNNVENIELYYRLKQTDFDGSNEIFNIVSAKCTDNNYQFGIYPNPFSDNLNITGNSDLPCLIQIFNATGEIVFEANSEINNLYNIKPSSFAPGIYYLRITDPDYNSHSFKLDKF